MARIYLLQNASDIDYSEDEHQVTHNSHSRKAGMIENRSAIGISGYTWYRRQRRFECLRTSTNFIRTSDTRLSLFLQFSSRKEAIMAVTSSVIRSRPRNRVGVLEPLSITAVRIVESGSFTSHYCYIERVIRRYQINWNTEANKRLLPNWFTIFILKIKNSLLSILLENKSLYKLDSYKSQVPNQ